MRTHSHTDGDNIIVAHSRGRANARTQTHQLRDTGCACAEETAQYQIANVCRYFIDTQCEYRTTNTYYYDYYYCRCSCVEHSAGRARARTAARHENSADKTKLILTCGNRHTRTLALSIVQLSSSSKFVAVGRIANVYR